MEQKAQGAIEYLLIIGAAILVVAVVIIALTGVLSGGQDVTDRNDVLSSTEKVACQADINALGGTNCSLLNKTNCDCYTKYSSSLTWN